MNPRLTTALRIVGLAGLAGAFAYAGALKWRDPLALADAIDGYRLPLGAITNAIAILLPPLEIVAALALLTRRWRRAGLLMLLMLDTVFLLALLQAAVRGIVVDCGCFGAEPPSAFGMAKAITRDLVIFGACRFLLQHERPQPTVRPCAA